MPCCTNFPNCGHNAWYLKTQDELRRQTQQRIWELSVPIPQNLGGGNSHFTYKPGEGWHVTTSLPSQTGGVHVHDWLKDFKF